LEDRERGGGSRGERENVLSEMEKNPPGKIVFCQITLPTFRGGKREREIGTALANYNQ
jgi:hypothetical protein